MEKSIDLLRDLILQVVTEGGEDFCYDCNCEFCRCNNTCHLGLALSALQVAEFHLILEKLDRQ